MKTIIYGARTHGKVILDILQECKIEVVGFIDDQATGTHAGLPILGTLKDLSRLKDTFDTVALGIGDNANRKKAYESLKKEGHSLQTCIHPNTKIAKNATIGEGSAICTGAIIAISAKIGKAVIINTGATVDHDDDIGDFSHISPGVHLGGEVRVGEGAWIGIGTSVNQVLSIGAWSIVGGGSSVIRNIPDKVMAAGVPATVKKQLDTEAIHIHEKADPTTESSGTKWKIPLFKIGWTKDDVDAVRKVIERGMFWAIGPEIETLEKAIATYCGRKHALVFNSGTSALHAALLAHNIKEKEVIVPTFTFISGVNTVVLAGGKPVFAETESETFGLDAEDVEKKITKKTKAIVPIHYGGAVSRDIEKIRSLCDKHNLILIEDAAESIGATLNGKKAGTFGHSAMFSFCQNKIVACGEGGAIVTDDDMIYHKMKMIRSHGRLELEQDYFSSVQDNDYLELGYNDRMNSMTAALCNSQLKRIDTVIAERQAIAHEISKRLTAIEEIRLPILPKEYNHVYQLYTILLPDKKTRDELQQHLEKAKIMTKVFFNCVHLKTYYRKSFQHKEGDLPITEQLSGRVLTLPFYPGMTNDEIDFLCSEIASFFQTFKKSPTLRDNR